jgi:hypothetical protein
MSKIGLLPSGREAFLSAAALPDREDEALPRRAGIPFRLALFLEFVGLNGLI